MISKIQTGKGDKLKEELDIVTNDDGVTMIDCHYQEPLQAAVYLLQEGDKAAFIDANTVFAVPRFLASLEKKGLTPEQVEYIIITHVHLDHSGGTAELLKHCPNAIVLVHARAARNLVDPRRLVAGAIEVYGQALFAKLYSEIEGISEDRIRVMNDGEILAWGSRRLHFFYTLGHAKHHFCIHDSASNAVFSGDSFGIGRSSLHHDGPSYLLCICAPPDFHAEQTKASLQQIVDTGAERVYIAHYGFFTELASGAEQVARSTDQMAAILQEAADTDLTGEALEDFCRSRVVEAMDEHLAHCGVTNVDAHRQWLRPHIGLNVKGLSFAAERQRVNAG